MIFTWLSIQPTGRDEVVFTRAGRLLEAKALWLGCDPTPDGPSAQQSSIKGYKRKYGKLPELGEDFMPDAEAEAADEVSSAGESSDSD